MKIAVTYENGEIFQHFGHTEQFKIYEVEDGKVVASEVVDTEGSGHGALADFLEDNSVEMVICGGIGGGALAALADRDIDLFSGASGNADEAVEKYLAGKLTNDGENCNHHHHDHDGHCCCGHHHDHDHEHCDHDHHHDHEHCDHDHHHDHEHCDHDHHEHKGKNVGKTVRTHYRGTFNDGTQFDSSYDRGEPLEFVCGAGMMIKGFDAAVADMEVGQTVNVHLMPSEAYGESDPEAIITVDMEQMPGSEELVVGQKVYLQNMYGQPVPVVIVAKDEKTITFDANHEMAGKELNFQIELVEIL